MSSEGQKFKRVLEKNTFYFVSSAFEEKNEAYLNSITETILLLQNSINEEGLKKETFEAFLASKKHGLKALLALTGFSLESLKRLITVTRISEDNALATLMHKGEWYHANSESGNEIAEWGSEKTERLLQTNVGFRSGIVNLFFEGATNSFLVERLPLFELKKLSIEKLQFKTSALVDSLVRFAEKGSYSGQAQNNPEIIIEESIRSCHLTYEKGDLPRLSQAAELSKRAMDFIIPNKQEPRIIIESSFLQTTSSGQGDKAKTEINMQKLIKRHYPQAKFIGFIDGIGWYVRKNDLKRMVSAYDDVYTFHPSELKRFKLFLESYRATVS